MNSKILIIVFGLVAYGNQAALAQSCHIDHQINGLMAFIEQSTGAVVNAQKTQVALKSCMSCHGPGGNAKAIPFDNDGSLKAYIKANPTFMVMMNKRMTSTSAFFKMPPNSKPLPDGVTGQDVLNYVTALDH